MLVIIKLFTMWKKLYRRDITWCKHPFLRTQNKFTFRQKFKLSCNTQENTDHKFDFANVKLIFKKIHNSFQWENTLRVDNNNITNYKQSSKGFVTPPTFIASILKQCTVCLSKKKTNTTFPNQHAKNH